MVFYSIKDALGGLSEIVEKALGVNFWELLINLLATIILILIVRFLFWNKVTAFLDKKKEKIKEEYRESGEIKAEAEEIKAEAVKTLDESKAQAQEIIRIAEDNATKEKVRIIGEANKTAQDIVSSSKEEAKKEKEQILKEAKDEVVDLASLMAQKMISEEIDVSKYDKSILDEIDEDKE